MRDLYSNDVETAAALEAHQALPPERELPHLEPECMEADEQCEGEVLMRWPGYGDRGWPRCQYHGDARLEREEQALERYGNPDSPCAPSGFDELDAGERWEDE